MSWKTSFKSLFDIPGPQEGLKIGLTDLPKSGVPQERHPWIQRGYDQNIAFLIKRRHLSNLKSGLFNW
jgi:hypothetical protein